MIKRGQQWKVALMPAAVVLVLLASGAESRAQTYAETILHAFTGDPDGGTPLAGVIRDAKGNLYGTTQAGGDGVPCGGCGTVFKLATNEKETVYSLQGGIDGLGPDAGVIKDEAGNLYGTAGAGGDTTCVGGCGVVFKIEMTGNETVLYSFAGGTKDGCNPAGNLIRDAAGNFYGTTVGCGTLGYGTVFKLTESGTETVLYSFAGNPTDGASPETGVIMDAKGNLYGTTFEGGPDNNCSGGCGTVFKLGAAGNETLLYSFDGAVGDEEYPSSGLIMDGKGNLYGTAGLGPCGGGDSACGWVYKLSASGTLTVLYNFLGGADGFWPFGGVIRDTKGNLYGTTSLGGANYINCSSGCGTVFKLSAAGKLTLLYSFAGGKDGSTPRGGVIMDTKGNLYGTTADGGGNDNCLGQGCGTVFKLTKN